jgi:hypothetical protein
MLHASLGAAAMGVTMAGFALAALATWLLVERMR